MSEENSPRRVLHLIVEGFSAEREKELSESADPTAEIVHLTEANAGEALEKIFAADTVAVWGKV